MPGRAAAPRGARAMARPAMRQACRGLIQVLAGPDPPPAWRWRSAPQLLAVYAAVGGATLALFALGLATMHEGLHTGIGPFPLARLQDSLRWRVLAAAVVLPLPLAIRYPLLAWRIAWLTLLLTPPLTGIQWGSWPGNQAQIPVLLVAFCVAGVRHPRPVLWWMWALTLIPWWLWIGPDLPRWPGSAAATILFTAAAIAVDSLTTRWRAQRALAAQTERVELEQARRAVLQERARIARELHDVVAHHMSLIAVRAETAPYRLGDLTEPVRAEFQSLSEAARAALADMRRLLGVLRDDRAAALAPQPQLSDLPVLVDAARRAGVSVELSVLAVRDPVPAGVGVCAYRIVQESLSNASRHAPGAAVTVLVAQRPGAVLLRVTNGPGGLAGLAAASGASGAARDGPAAGPGHGLAGMRERVALLGGSLSAGPAPDGGFVVSAVLPLGAAA
jgi:signal transduction histidine kinase